MEAVRPESAPVPATEAEPYRREDDPIVIPAHVFCPPPKTTVAADFADLKRCLLAPEDAKASTEADAYAAALTSAREGVVTLLHSESGSESVESLETGLQKYISLLLGLTSKIPGSAGPAAGKAWEPLITADSYLRSSVSFSWQDALQGNKDAVAARDAVFEAASVLLSAAVWRMRRAAVQCSAQPGAVPADVAGQVHKSLRSAAGLFAFVSSDCTKYLLNAIPSQDIHPQVLSAYESVCLADAQGITVLRAISKGNTPSLVAELAADSADLYRHAATAGTAAVPRDAAGASAAVPVAAYASWKAAAFDAYAFAFAGQALMAEKSEAKNQAGKAVRLLDEALAKLEAALKASAAFSALAPGGKSGKKAASGADQKGFDAALERTVKAAHAKIKRENDVIYYQRVPLELPEVPPGRRLVKATPYVLPPAAKTILEGVLDLFGRDAPPVTAQIVPPLPAPSTTGKPGEAGGKPGGEDGEEAASASCWRWALVVLAAPFLLIISLVGAVVWLLLLPVKIVCCPIGCAAQVVWNAVEWGLKAPFRALLWASGKPWRPAGPLPRDPEAPPHRDAKMVAA